MKLFSFNMPDNYEIVKASDIHKGLIHHSSDAWGECIEYVGKTKNCFMTIDGDLMESRTVDHPYFQWDAADPKLTTPQKQRNSLIADLKPIRKKVLVIGKGNHEHALERNCNHVVDICDQLEIPYGTWSYKTTFCDKKGIPQWKMHSTHGTRIFKSNAPDPIRNEANRLVQLKDALKFIFGDCTVHTHAHAHTLLIAKPKRELYLVDELGHIKQKYTETNQHSTYIPEDLRWYACTGSFLKTFQEGVDGYAERGGFPPTELGYIKIVVENRQVADIVKVKL